MSEQAATSSDDESMLAKLIFGSAGLAFQVAQEAPKLVDAGREKVDPQLRQARFLGELTVTYGSYELKRRIGALKQRFDRPEPSPAAPPTSSDEPVEAVTGDPGEPVVTIDPSSLPIGDYETLAASHIIKLLDGLDADELRRVEAYEQSTRARQTILGRIEQLTSADTSTN